MDNYCTKCGRRNDAAPAPPGVNRRVYDPWTGQQVAGPPLPLGWRVVRWIYGLMPLGPIGWALVIAGLLGYAGSK